MLGLLRKPKRFKKAASCFGLGRYLYNFTGIWVDLDERKRPQSTPRLAGWATPGGWSQGLRPHNCENPGSPQSPTGRLASPDAVSLRRTTRRSQRESQSAWEGLLGDLYRRGLRGEKLEFILTDGCAGLAAAIQTVYPQVDVGTRHP